MANEVVMNTSIERGRSFVYSALGASDDHAAGEVIVIGTALVGFLAAKCAGATVRAASIAADEIPSPDRGALIYEHEDVAILKNTSLIITAGDLVFWDVADNEVNKTASGNYQVGVALETADTADTTVRIAFDGAHQHLADYTAEAGTFFGATDITGAEAETLTDGSNADAKHVHDTAGLTADCIDSTLIADNALDSEHYTDGSIDTAHIAADQIDDTLIADNVVGVEHMNEAVIQVDTVEITAVELCDLEANPHELVAAPGADELVELISAVFTLDYSGGAMSETDAPDDLTIAYDDGTGAVAWTADSTGFITSGADAILTAVAQDVNGAAASVTAAANVAKNLALCNSDSDFTIGASTSVLQVVITYRIITCALAA